MLGPIKIDIALRSADEGLWLINSNLDDSHANLIADKLTSCKTTKEINLSRITQEMIPTKTTML